MSRFHTTVFLALQVKTFAALKSSNSRSKFIQQKMQAVFIFSIYHLEGYYIYSIKKTKKKSATGY